MSSDDQTDGVLDALRAHPWMTAVVVACTLLGLVLGYALLGQDWSVGHRLVAGAVGGAGVGLVIAFTRMLGAWGE